MIYNNWPTKSSCLFFYSYNNSAAGFQVNALPVNRCLTYLVAYTKLDSVGHIFHGGHSHKSTRLTRSNNSIPRSINLLLKSFFIFWFKDDTSCKNSLQWGKIRHSYQAARRNLFARSGAESTRRYKFRPNLLWRHGQRISREGECVREGGDNIDHIRP